MCSNYLSLEWGIVLYTTMLTVRLNLTHPASGVVLKLQRYNPLKTGALFQCWRDKVGEWHQGGKIAYCGTCDHLDASHNR